MLNKHLCSEVLAVAMSTGADFAEIYQELTRNNSIHLIDGKIDSVGDSVLSGVGVRAFLGTRTVYATTTDLSREGIVACAKNAAEIMGELKKNISVNQQQKLLPRHKKKKKHKKV